MGDAGQHALVFEDLELAVQAMGEYRQQVVLVGGLVPVFYRHLWGDEQSRDILATTDIDLLTPGSLSLLEGKGLDQMLEEAGFQLQFRHGDDPPSAKYHHTRHAKDRPPPITLEFITERCGGAKEGQQKKKVQEGFYVPELPFVQILSDRPLGIDLFQIGSSSIEEPLEIQVPIRSTTSSKKC